jgi:outer membrane protein insertion porin family
LIRLATLLAILLAGWPGLAGAEIVDGFPFSGEPRTVTAVELRLPRGVEVEGLTGLVPIRAGQPLTRRDLRRTVRLLYETGRFRQVRAHVRPDGGGVAVTLVLLPRQRVAEISFLGARSVDRERLERAAGVRRGEELSGQGIERLTASVRRTYARLGYLDVAVDTEIREADDGQVALLVRIDEGRRTRISAIVWEGETGLDPEILNEVLGLEPGDPLDLTVIEDALDEVRARYQAAGHMRARVGMPRVEPEKTTPGVEPGGEGGVSFWPGEPRATLIVPVSAGPLLALRVTGNRFFSTAEIESLFDLGSDVPVDADTLEDGRRRIARAYRLAGYAHAVVDVEEAPRSPRLHEVRVRIDEGPPMRVRTLAFPGATALGERWLRQQFCEAVEAVMPSPPLVLETASVESFGGRKGYRADPPPSSSRPRPDPCTVYEEEVYARVVGAIADRYRREGWLDVRIAAPEVAISPDRRIAHVRIAVEEGVQTRIASVAFEGLSALDEAAVRSAVGLRVGAPLSTAAVEEARFSVRGLYARQGHPFATAEPEVRFGEDRREATVVYRVTEGPRVEVGRIIVRGHQNTPASLVRSQLTFRPGDRWDLDRVQASQRRILSLGIYRAASIRLLDPEEPAPVMDVVITVSERRPKAIEMGVGVSTEDGPRVFAEYADLAFVWNSELHTRAKANYPIFPAGLELRRVLTPGMEWEAQAGLRFPTLLAARTDVVGERANRPTYGLTRVAWSVGADTRWRDDLTASLGVEMEYVDFERAAPDPDIFLPDRERRRFEEGQTLLASLRPGVTLDLRDHRVSPRSGVLAGAALDWSHDLGLGVPIHFLKASASLSGYVPASTRVTVALSARGGVVVPLSEDNVTIEPKRFFLGGADTLRGFPLDGVVPADQRSELHEKVDACRTVIASRLCSEDALLVLQDGLRPASAGGEAFVLLKGELRFPIRGGLQGGVFVDAGNLWRETGHVDLTEIRTTAGGGLRYETPVGPVALDLGWNIVPDPILHEMPFALHFAIGLF